MSTFEFIIALTQSLSWPVAILASVLVIRHEMRKRK